MSWHIISCERVVKENGKFLIQAEVFIQLIQGENKTGESLQDSHSVISLMSLALRKHKKYHPEVKRAILRAGMYISTNVLFFHQYDEGFYIKF